MGVGEDSYMIQLDLCYKVTQLLESGLCFPRMSDDKCGAKEDPRKILASPLDHRIDALADIAAPHQLEQLVINVLQRTVDVTNHARTVGHHRK